MSAIISKGSWVRALVFVAAVLGTPHHAAANVLQHDRSEWMAAAATRTAEPFGLFTSALPEGPLPAKWRDVERSIEAERETLADCRTSPDTCISQPAIQFLRIVSNATARQGLARLGEINRAFNLAIRPVSDRAQYGVDDRWASPLATLASGAGDCEDYAIAKLVALREAGVAQEYLRLIIVRETAIGDDHAVAAARIDGRWHILDNRTMVMIEDS
ncbi:MAG: transglutaminase-like cysteine peptidase, partial [Pseudomonadota bacterium]